MAAVDIDAEYGDLKSRQFAQVLSSVPTAACEPAAVRCRKFLQSAAQNAFLRSVLVGLCSAALLLLIRPPFVIAFEYDKTRPWKARSHISWLSVACASILAGGAAGAIPILC